MKRDINEGNETRSRDKNIVSRNVNIIIPQIGVVARTDTNQVDIAPLPAAPPSGKSHDPPVSSSLLS